MHEYLFGDVLSGTGSGEEPGGVVVHGAVVSPLRELLVEQGE